MHRNMVAIATMSLAALFTLAITLAGFVVAANHDGQAADAWLEAITAPRHR